VQAEAEADKRHALRIAVDLPARFRSETQSVDGRALNLSRGGIRFVGSAPRLGPSLAPLFDEVDTGPVFLEIDLPDEERPLSLRGVVCWSEAGPTRAVGIRFTHLPPPESRRLANFVIRRACRQAVVTTG
jgi:PilZ domain-containing protein